jgi:hypothetical protein
MKVLNVTYNSKKDETTIMFTEAFNNACGLQKLQIIEDLIAAINKQHDALCVWVPVNPETGKIDNAEYEQAVLLNSKKENV